jgi:fructosamine-3-kinase
MLYIKVRVPQRFRVDEDLGDGKRRIVVGPSDKGQTGLLLAKAKNAEEQSRIGNQVARILLHNIQLTCRVARFFLVLDTKAGKMYQMNTKCTKWS